MGCASSRDDTADAKPTSVTDVTPNMTTPTKKPMAKARASTPELRAAEESKAATAVAAAYRGHAGRAKAANIKAPCNTYRLNLKSESFGDCQCGWSKASHSPAALLAGGAGKPSAKRQASAKELPASFFEKAAAECTRYEVNMKSANFGECVCGWPRAQHSAAALAAASLKEEKTTCMDAEELRKQFVQKELAACTKYVVNMQAANFGECVCGRPKAEHTAAALGGDQAEATRRRSKSTTMSTEQEAKLRKQMSAKGLSTGCAKYQVNLESARFGECVCGRLRNEHTPEALAASSSSRRPSISDEADLRRLSEAIEEKTTADPEAAAAAPWGRTGSWLSGLASAITTSPEKPGEEVAQGA